jgi:hypothetical protein
VTNYNSGIPNAEYSYGVAKGRQGTNAMPAELDPAITSSRKPGLDPFTDYLVLETRQIHRTFEASPGPTVWLYRRPLVQIQMAIQSLQFL